MMAAATCEQPKPTQYRGSKRELLQVCADPDDGKPHSDVSEQDYYDAQSQLSASSPAEPLDSLDQTDGDKGAAASGPKIVETVAKKLLEADAKAAGAVDGVKLLNRTADESVIEREIRLQKEREEALVRERQAAVAAAMAVSSCPMVRMPASPGADERSVLVDVTSVVTPPPIIGAGAETKIAIELREMREREEELRRLRQRLSVSNKEDTDGLGASPDDGFNSIPNTDEGNFSEYGSEEKELSLDGNSRVTSPEVPRYSHQRTQSMDSISSGHSSGSGGNTELYSASNHRRRVTVKPYEEPEDAVMPTYGRNTKETPIEREIRLASQREEELRRDKGLAATAIVTLPVPPTAQTLGPSPGLTPGATAGPTAGHTPAPKAMPPSVPKAASTPAPKAASTPGTKPVANRLYEMLPRRIQKSVSTSQLSSPEARPRVHKGLMERFLLSRGKMTSLSPPGPSPVGSPRKSHVSTQSAAERERAGTRPRYTPAEQKIQVELKEMQKREEELRLQRARMFAQSQPNLLSLIDEDEDQCPVESDMESLPKLRVAVSNPNLLDAEDCSLSSEPDASVEKQTCRNTRKRSLLIAQWENRIRSAEQ